MAIDIDTAANQPQSASADGQAVTQRSIQDLIAARRDVDAQTALTGSNTNSGPKSGWGALRTAKAIPPGAV